MNIKLVKLSYDYKEQFLEMMDEWKAYNDANPDANHSPWAIFRNDYHDFDNYLEKYEIKEETENLVPDETFFCLDEDRNIFVGAVNIRKCLNENNRISGGHIGDGIRPSERKKGYATAMLALALKECERLGIYKVLITCDKDNIGSEKAIIKNGGIFEAEVCEDGEIEKRYWISIKDETIETDRLILRRLMPTDYKAMSAWTKDARVYKYLLGNPIQDEQDIINYIRRNDPNSKSRYVMLILDKKDGHAIGVVGCSYDKEDTSWEISYSIRYDDWGKGYSTEAAIGLRDYLIDENGATLFKGECAKENIASRRILEKMGLVYNHDSSYTKHDGSVTYESMVYMGDF